MLARRSRLLLAAAAAVWSVAAVGAFRASTLAALHRRPQETPTRLRHSSDNDCDRGDLEDRRRFLSQLSTAMSGTLATPLLVTSLAYADDGDVETATETLEVETATSDQTAPDADIVEGDKSVEGEDDKRAIEKVDALVKDESELDAEIVRDEADEKKSIDDTQQLIDELEKEILIEENESSTPEDVEKEADIVRNETDALIKEEEQLKSETEEMITKIETLESEVQSLDAGDKTEGDGAATEKVSEAFVDKLKERVEQQEDLITRLKRQSERDIDPKTGKFKAMTAQEYRERAKSTDVDFLQFLKDTVANEKEWERDLEAFEGFLDRELGPAVKELSKDLKPLVKEAEKDLGPLVGEMENELRKEVAPAMGDALQQLKQKAGSAADGEAEELKRQAGDLIGKIRSIF